MKNFTTLMMTIFALSSFATCDIGGGGSSNKSLKSYLLLQSLVGSASSSSSSSSGGGAVGCGSGQTVYLRFTNCTWYSSRNYQMITTCSGGGTFCGPTWYTYAIFSGSGCLSTGYQAFDAAGKQWYPASTTQGHPSCSGISYTFTAGKYYDIQEGGSGTFFVNMK